MPACRVPGIEFSGSGSTFQNAMLGSGHLCATRGDGLALDALVEKEIRVSGVGGSLLCCKREVSDP
jgi:hypothetical protein